MRGEAWLLGTVKHMLAWIKDVKSIMMIYFNSFYVRVSHLDDSYIDGRSQIKVHIDRHRFTMLDDDEDKCLSCSWR